MYSCRMNELEIVFLDLTNQDSYSYVYVWQELVYIRTCMRVDEYIHGKLYYR